MQHQVEYQPLQPELSDPISSMTVFIFVSDDEIIILLTNSTIVSLNRIMKDQTCRGSSIDDEDLILAYVQTKYYNRLNKKNDV